MYLPPSDLADRFRSFASLQLEYDELHRAYNPGFLGALLGHLGLRAMPNWPSLQARLKKLDASIRECIAASESHLLAMQNHIGSVPTSVQLPYRLMVATANSVIALRAIVDTMEASDGDPGKYSASQMMIQQRHYREKRAEMSQAAAAWRNMQ